MRDLIYLKFLTTEADGTLPSCAAGLVGTSHRTPKDPHIPTPTTSTQMHTDQHFTHLCLLPLAAVQPAILCSAAHCAATAYRLLQRRVGSHNVRHRSRRVGSRQATAWRPRERRPHCRGTRQRGRQQGLERQRAKRALQDGRQRVPSYPCAPLLVAVAIIGVASGGQGVQLQRWDGDASSGQPCCQGISSGCPNRLPTPLSRPRGPARPCPPACAPVPPSTPGHKPSSSPLSPGSGPCPLQTRRQRWTEGPRLLVPGPAPLGPQNTVGSAAGMLRRLRSGICLGIQGAVGLAGPQQRGHVQLAAGQVAGGLWGSLPARTRGPGGVGRAPAGGGGKGT